MIRPAVLVVALAVSAPALAQSWDKPDKVLRAAKKSLAPTLVLSERFDTTRDPADPKKKKTKGSSLSIQLAKEIAGDDELKQAFDGFSFGAVNCWNLSYKSKDYLDPRLVKKWGTPWLLRVYAPGAEQPLWESEMPKDPTDARARRSKLLEAAASYKPTRDTLARLLTFYKAKNLKDRALKKNAAAQVDLAKMWARAKSLPLALEHYDRAISAVRTKKGGARKVASYMKAKAALAVKVGDTRTGIKLYRGYLSKFRKASDRGATLLLICKLCVEVGDRGAAMNTARSIKRDPTLADYHADANEFLTSDPDDKK